MHTHVPAHQEHTLYPDDIFELVPRQDKCTIVLRDHVAT